MALDGMSVRFLEGVRDGAGFSITVPNGEKAFWVRGSVSRCRVFLGKVILVGIFEIDLRESVVCV